MKSKLFTTLFCVVLLCCGCNEDVVLVSPEDLSVSDLPGVSHHSIVLQADGNGVLYSSFTQAQSGQSVMVKATAGVNYRFNRWLVESGNVQLQNASSAETSFVMGNEGVLLRAVFDALPTYGLLISDDGHGYGVADIDSAADLVTVSITAYPNPYFTFKEWVVVQGIVTNVDPHRTHTSFTMPAEFVELRATFNRFTRCDEAGMGTLSEPYVIYFEEQMADLANQVNGGRDMSGVYFSLQEDISLGNYTDWQAIGDSTGNAFRGEFDGNGFTISDVTIAPPRETPWNNSEPDCYIGLFGCIDGGSVKNVSVQGTLLPQQFEEGDKYVGSVIGYLKSGVVENLSANFQIVIQVGGLAPLFRHHFWLGGVIGKSDVGLSGVSLSFAGSISFEPGRDHQCAVGRKVGWGVDAATTGVLNNNQGVSDPLITIRSIWNNRNLYVNGVK